MAGREGAFQDMGTAEARLTKENQGRKTESSGGWVTAVLPVRTEDVAETLERRKISPETAWATGFGENECVRLCGAGRGWQALPFVLWCWVVAVEGRVLPDQSRLARRSRA